MLSTGIPLMLSLLINSLYHFVDSIFVSRVSEQALTAVSLAAPVQMMISALGLGNAIGLNAVISKALGQQRPDKSSESGGCFHFYRFLRLDSHFRLLPSADQVLFRLAIGW